MMGIKKLDTLTGQFRTIIVSVMELVTSPDGTDGSDPAPGQATEVQNILTRSAKTMDTYVDQHKGIQMHWSSR